MLSLILLSCENDFELSDNNVSEPTVSVEKKVENGRFIFSNRESLKVTIDDFQKDHISNVEKEFEKLYHKGFRSHTPIINPDNEELKAKLSEEILQKRSNNPSKVKKTDDDYDDEENYIADPLLASVVNQNDEIIVNDTLYKFTKEKGLFFSHVKDSTYLFDYFKQEEEKERKGNFNTTFKSNPCQMKSMNGGVTRVNSQVSRYIRPANDWCPEEGVSRSRPTPSPLPSFPETSEEEKLQEIINELKECSGSRPVFQNLFGKRFVCRDHFASDRRIKTEFWDQSWHFYKSVGIQTKTQKRTLRVWWASKSDEIHLGINTILLKYNFPQPQINSYSHPQLFPAN